MRTRLLTLALLLLSATALAIPAYAQERADLTGDPGYIDLALVESWFDEEAKIEINIKGTLLELVAEASRYEDPDLANLLTKLQAIQVRGFDVTAGQFGSVSDRMRSLARRLEDGGWETVVRVREEDEHVHMFTRIRDGAVAGMMVMVFDETDAESIFVNVVGEISPEEIGRIGQRFNIDPLSRAPHASTVGQ